MPVFVRVWALGEPPALPCLLCVNALVWWCWCCGFVLLLSKSRHFIEHDWEATA